MTDASSLPLILPTQPAPTTWAAPWEGKDAADEVLTAVVTGFEPFDGGETNASWLAVRELPEVIALAGGRLEVYREELPVTFAGAAARSRALIEERRPDIIIHVGLNARAEGVMLETTAYNEQKASIPDNAGHTARGEEVVAGGTPVLHSTWLASAIAGRLSGVGLPVLTSDDAGRYVCNTTLYTAVDAMGALPGPRHAGFVHVPGPERIPTEVVTASLTALLVELADEIRRARSHAAGYPRLAVARPERPLRLGLTGGIGAGKSTVATFLAARGCEIIDADRLAREVVAPGQGVLEKIREAFGDGVIDAAGGLDRAAMAEVIFGDETARQRLEALMLPAIAFEAGRRMGASKASAAVYDVPLLAEGHMADLFDAVIVVESSEELRLERLASRGLTEGDARARMASQASDAQRREVADAVILNNGSQEDLAQAVGALADLLGL